MLRLVPLLGLCLPSMRALDVRGLRLAERKWFLQRVTTGHCGTADRSVTSASKMGPIQQRKSQVKRDLVHISRSGSEMVSACMDGSSGEEPLRGWLLQDYERLLRVQDSTSNSMLSMCVIQDHVPKFEPTKLFHVVSQSFIFPQCSRCNRFVYIPDATPLMSLNPHTTTAPQLVQGNA